MWIVILTTGIDPTRFNLFDFCSNTDMQIRIRTIGIAALIDVSTVCKYLTRYYIKVV